ncbi:uncharacterized protein LOC130892595 isoform X2 [Diorhabda carinulata]|uniref:uncharacterized protein LOC130892595 isoform X2 n=1 Tax=Diorhabda carinulata TaxID=1163345 RepID=UPI0025A2DFDA|nr:uncharacterized protein LOC130892595 isoform X2 [Diorhabda carinulata]
MSDSNLSKSSSGSTHPRTSVNIKTSPVSNKSRDHLEKHSKTSITDQEIKDSSKTTLKEDLIDVTPLEETEDEKPRTISDLIGPPKHESLGEFHRRTLKNEDLFSTVVTVGSYDKLVEVKKEVPSILVTGFGMRNLTSLQNALEEENKRIKELYQRQQKLRQTDTKLDVSTKTPSRIVSKSSISTTESSKTRIKTSTETLTDKTDIVPNKFNLQYLMECEEEDEFVETEKETGVEKKDSFVYSNSTTMRKAQHYLRVHRIFDFFQFIIAQLLGAAPDNPIYFILELLNKCLLYRSGAGPPPLLYEVTHIAQLFNLMDRMGTGFIDMEQYKQGMVTLGICDYNKKPFKTEEGISKKTFIEEVYEAEVALFDDLIRRKYIDKKDRKYTDRPIDYSIQTQDSKTSYFMPKDLFETLKPLSQIKEDVEGERDG